MGPARWIRALNAKIDQLIMSPKSTQSKEIANFCHQVVLWPQHVAWYACVPSRRYTKQMSFKLLNWAWRDSLVGKDPSMHPPPPARQAWWAEFIPRFHVWSFHLSVYSVSMSVSPSLYHFVLLCLSHCLFISFCLCPICVFLALFVSVSLFLIHTHTHACIICMPRSVCVNVCVCGIGVCVHT